MILEIFSMLMVFNDVPDEAYATLERGKFWAPWGCPHLSSLAYII